MYSFIGANARIGGANTCYRPLGPIQMFKEESAKWRDPFFPQPV